MTLTIKNLLQVVSLLLFLTLSPVSYAQTDSAALYQQRKFDGSSLKKYAAQQDFKYEDNADEGQMDLMGWLWYKFLQMLHSLLGSKGENNVIKIICYSLAIFAIVAIVLNLMGVEIRRFFVRDSQTIISPYMMEENIREMNMDDLIAEAVSRKQWRLAVRYLYLKALRMMTDRDLIRWIPGKTNMDYYYELSAEDIKATFLTATDDFENAWYGNGEVTEKHYAENKKHLEDFYTMIKRHTA